MGHYLEVPERNNKRAQLIKLHGAEDIGLPPASLARVPKGKTLICVVENGPFDAAGIAYSDEELKEFKVLDGRPRTWLLMDTEEVVKMKPNLAEYLRGERDWSY